MFGAIYIGLSGLTAYSKGLQTVSNNVSNMNTSGFKAANVTFTDIVGKGSNGGLEYGYGYASTGHGVAINQIDMNFTQGELRNSDGDLDLAIDGNGFFALQDGEEMLYARTGSFVLDNDGYVVLSGTKYRMTVLDGSGNPVAVNISGKRSNPPKATDAIKFNGNLSSGGTVDPVTKEFTYNISKLKIYDAQGGEHSWSVKFSRKETVTDKWTVTVTDGDDKVVDTKELKFFGGQVAAESRKLQFEDNSKGLSVEFDFSESVTSYSTGSVSSLAAAKIEGRPSGEIATLTVNKNGKLEIAYTNEEKLELESIALADFRDPQKLTQRGNGLFFFEGYGQRQFLNAEDLRVGTIMPKKLEASNVDLGAQFGDLILIQRGFQASSQIISVSNDMIQQLFGIRGQG